ncbi:hypothetical protein C8Q70DRAFT_715217 [Cubamyces menziesii]|nr:hypothetical protein C8Q70DRAFT_715217 [Cubamyces menziesii]
MHTLRGPNQSTKFYQRYRSANDHHSLPARQHPPFSHQPIPPVTPSSLQHSDFRTSSVPCAHPERRSQASVPGSARAAFGVTFVKSAPSPYEYQGLRDALLLDLVSYGHIIEHLAEPPLVLPTILWFLRLHAVSHADPLRRVSSWQSDTPAGRSTSRQVVFYVRGTQSKFLLHSGTLSIVLSTRSSSEIFRGYLGRQRGRSIECNKCVFLQTILGLCVYYQPLLSNWARPVGDGRVHSFAPDHLQSFSRLQPYSTHLGAPRPNLDRSPEAGPRFSSDVFK